MDDKYFMQAFALIEAKFRNLEVNRAFNSIGSNIFLDFGDEKEIIAANGRKRIQKDWSIWVSNASWRIIKDNKYVVGSGDSRESIQLGIQNLLGKRFLCLKFLSLFLDIEFHFSDGYRLTTFFNSKTENQWTIFLPDQTDIGVDCSKFKTIKSIQKLATCFSLDETYQKLDFLLGNDFIQSIRFNNENQPTIHFNSKATLSLQKCTWRLEKNNRYLIGYLDDNSKKTCDQLSKLIGKKMIQLSANSLFDAKFEFEEGYVLKTFTCCHSSNQWEFSSNFQSKIKAVIQFESSK